MKKKIPIFRYLHKDKLNLTSNQKIIILTLVILCIFFLLFNKPISVVTIIFTVIFTIIVYPKRNILITQRYLICGNKIIYYKHIKKIIINSNEGTLLIYSDNNDVFVLEKELFSTNARKPQKIINNKNNKFIKVSTKIIDNIKKISPNVELISSH